MTTGGDFLVHTRPQDRGGHLILGIPRRNPGSYHRQEDSRVQSFVVTRCGADTMTQRPDVENITEAGAASVSVVDRVLPVQVSDDPQRSVFCFPCFRAHP